MAQCSCYHHARLRSEASATMEMGDTLSAKVAELRRRGLHKAAEAALATAQARGARKAS